MSSRKNYSNVDITGKRFGKLVTLYKIPTSRTQWMFECDCGNQIRLPISRVLYGQLSCGCLGVEMKREWGNSHTIHGDSKTKLYRKYKSMIDRCYNPQSPKYQRYGGRGITVCDEWKNSFESFKMWAYETGYSPDIDGRNFSLDRNDNNRGYSPDNCRWATAYEQMKNRECTKLYPYKGNDYSASEFADRYGIEKSFVYLRVKKGQSLEEILNDWTQMHNIPDNLIKSTEYTSIKGISLAHTNRLIKKGKIKAVRIGRRWYIDKNEL